MAGIDLDLDLAVLGWEESVSLSDDADGREWQRCTRSVRPPNLKRVGASSAISSYMQSLS